MVLLVYTIDRVSSSRAVIFDFNGTISDDEPLLDALFTRLLADRGITLTSEVYWRDLAGLSDPEIVRRALALGAKPVTDEACDELLAAKVVAYKDAVTASPTISADAADAVRTAAARVPIAIASGAVREEVEHVLAIAGLRDAFSAVVCIDDVDAGKPDPAGFLLALELLGGVIAPADVLVVEDADAGVRAARAAGMRVAAITGPALTVVPDEPIERLDAETMERLLA